MHQNTEFNNWYSSYPSLTLSSVPAVGGGEGGGGRRHCLILCKLFQSLQVFNRFAKILHSQLLQVPKFFNKIDHIPSFNKSDEMMHSTVLHRIVMQTHYIYHSNIALNTVHMVHPSCKQVHLNYSSYVQDGKLQCKHFTYSYL